MSISMVTERKGIKIKFHLKKMLLKQLFWKRFFVNMFSPKVIYYFIWKQVKVILLFQHSYSLRNHALYCLLFNHFFHKSDIKEVGHISVKYVEMLTVLKSTWMKIEDEMLFVPDVQNNSTTSNRKAVFVSKTTTI